MQSLCLRDDESHFAALAALPDLPSLTTLMVTHALTGNEDMRWVRRVPNVSGLNLEAPRADRITNLRAKRRPEPSTIAGQFSTVDQAVAELALLNKLYLLRLNGQRIGDASAAHLASLEQLHWLELNDTLLGDQGVKRLAALGSLKTLFLDRTKITNEGVLVLAELGNLQNLTLNGTAITDKALEALANCPLRKSIRSLGLEHTAITDAGLKALADATQLQSLNIMNTRVTDAGLVHLRNLKSLGNLAVAGTAITQDGIAELKPYLPGLGKIHIPARAGEPDKLAAIRPLVKARLKNGQAVECLLMRFADGVYTVKQPETLAEIRESDIWEITFVGPKSSAQGNNTLRERLAFLSQPACVQDLIDAYSSLGAKAAGQFADLLADSDLQVRRMAAQAISNWGTWGRTGMPPDLQAPLIKTLHDDNPQVRHLVLGALGRLGESSDDVVAPLAETLAKDPDGQVGQAVVQSLRRIALRRTIGDPALKTIVEAFGHAATDHPEDHVRMQAIAMLGSLGEKGQGAAGALSRAFGQSQQFRPRRCLRGAEKGWLYACRGVAQTRDRRRT